jgi:hypothetical protein
MADLCVIKNILLASVPVFLTSLHKRVNELPTCKDCPQNSTGATLFLVLATKRKPLEKCRVRRLSLLFLRRCYSTKRFCNISSAFKLGKTLGRAIFGLARPAHLRLSTIY